MKCPGILICLLLFTGYPFISYSQIDDIPQTSGFGGNFVLGSGYANMSSNQIAGGVPLVREIGYESIESINEAPKSRWSGSMGVAGEINYTFSKSRMQVFFGNRMEDLLRLDAAFGLGIRKELRDSSIIAFSALATPLNVQFWQDPYIENEDRIPDDVRRPGFRLRWGRMFGTGLEVTFTARRILYDNESSGFWLVEQDRLRPEETPLLDRRGDVLTYQFLYRIDRKKHRFEPTLIITDNGRKGQAMAGWISKVKLTYLYRNPKKIIIDFNILVGYKSTNEVNPIYLKTASSYRFGTALIFIKPFRLREHSILSVYIGGEFYREYSNIDFYDSYINWFNFGFLWRYQRS